jgi:Zn-dependent protease
MQTFSILQTVAIWMIPVLFAITLHEAAHAWVASQCGDTTAKALGRLSINPINHIDPIGTVLVPIVIAVLSGFQFIFGWAKPVPINWFQLRNPRRDMALVAVAGPLSNVIMAMFWVCCAKLGLTLDPSTSQVAAFMFLTGKAGIMINLIFALLNLIPIPPLDGSRVVASLLPPAASHQYMKLEPFGFVILVILMFTGILGWILFPPLAWCLQLFYRFL